ncbi:MAG: DUF2075 domain-containing protein [Clostridia bacterium]|nr:DUF2075 domain-containing protein [Clostridia bacterium]
MRGICLSSIIDVLHSNNDSLIEVFSSLNSFELKEHEISDFIHLARKIVSVCSKEQQMGFYIGQKTKCGLCEEFDFLRYSFDSVINIEVKSEWPPKKEKCLEQLLSHRNILRLLKRETLCYVYIVKSDELLELREDELVLCEFDELRSSIKPDYLNENLLHSIDLTTMLVSPYSDPEKFVNHEYVLTQNQSEIKSRIISSDEYYSIIKGRAGTGKSLLLMDIACHYRSEGKNVIVFLCRNVSSKSYLSNALDIRIEEIKMIETMIDNNTIDDYDVILFDEAQRIRIEQLNKICTLSLLDWKIVFSLDPLQTLNQQELSNEVSEKICTLDNSHVYELSNRIRANDAIDLFSRRLIHLNCKKWHPVDFSCIHLSFFVEEECCVDYLSQLLRENRTIIEPTPYTTKFTKTEKRKKHFSGSRDPHSVLGEEFDDVVVLLDEYVNYVEKEDETKLESTYPEYYPYDMNHCIYEAVTRAKRTLEIVVLNNYELFVAISGIIKSGCID